MNYDPMDYDAIMKLEKRRLGEEVAYRLFGEERPSWRMNYALAWKTFGRVVYWVQDQGCLYKMGNDPDQRDAYFSVLLGDQWVGMRGSTPMIAGCRAALMMVCRAWPPGVDRERIERAYQPAVRTP